jgi:hypothetical protein
MSGTSVLHYLKELCQLLDGRGDAHHIRRAAATLVIPAAALGVGCLVEPPSVALYGVPDYGAPFDGEVCSDGIDNDSDGLLDCEDDECMRKEVCLSCVDGLDNDGDGQADCDDESCALGEGCLGDCNDAVDDDSDALVDCDDPDCAGGADCP